jgi:hypothetical protein
MAQSNVYSLNVVGYVNTPSVGGFSFNMLANPLNNANNGITNLFQNVNDGDQILFWNTTLQDVDPTVYTYSQFAHTWDGNRIVKPGEGFFYLNTGNNFTNTFVGEVIQGSYTNPVPVKGNFSFNFLASSVPLGGSFTNAIAGFTPSDGDQVSVWNTTLQDVDPTVATYSAFAHAWDNPNIPVAPGNGLLYLGTGPDINQWVRNFTVQ